MASITDIQAAFDAYVTAVNARLADLEAQAAAVDLDPLASSIASAEAALNPAPAVDPAPTADA